MTVIVAALGWSWRETEVDPLTGAVSADRRDRGPGQSELAALEHALRLGQRQDARVVAATVGPAEAEAMLRDALAAGAADALRVEPAGWTAGPRPAGGGLGGVGHDRAAWREHGEVQLQIRADRHLDGAVDRAERADLLRRAGLAVVNDQVGTCPGGQLGHLRSPRVDRDRNL